MCQQQVTEAAFSQYFNTGLSYGTICITVHKKCIWTTTYS